MAWTGDLRRSIVLRYALGYMAVFCASVAAVLVVLAFTTADLIGEQTEDAIEAEVQGLAEQYRQRGLPGLLAVIERRSNDGAVRESVYLLAGRDLRPLAGNLTNWPRPADGVDGWVDFTAATLEAPDKGARPFRARVFTLPGGLHLLVGRDNSAITRFQHSVTDALAVTLVMTIVLGAAGGLVLSRRISARLEAVNRSARAILDGDMSRRVPVGTRGDEFDRMAANLNAALDRIDRLVAGMRQVTGTVAHELRSPLNRLRTRLEVTLLKDRSPDGYREAIAGATAETDKLLATFEALLAIALAESGAARETFAPVDLADLVNDLGELYGAAAEEAGLTLSVEPAVGGPAMVDGNAAMVTQAVGNLLDNAIKFTPPGGGVRLRLHRAGSRLRLTVADSGPGIPADQRARVLERFVRLVSADAAPGAGLGLSLVAAVAGQHDATLTLDDAAPGLIVTLDFPARTPADHPRPHPRPKDDRHELAADRRPAL